VTYIFGVEEGGRKPPDKNNYKSAQKMMMQMKQWTQMTLLQITPHNAFN